MSRLVVQDAVPAGLRCRWSDAGFYANKSLFALLLQRASEQPACHAVVDAELVVTYRQLLARASAVANVFASAGIEPGSVVGVQLDNGWRAAVVDASVAALGGVCLPYPTGLGRQDVESLLARSEAVAVVTASQGKRAGAPMLRTLRRSLPKLKEVFVVDETAPGATDMREALDSGDAAVAVVDVDPNAPARIVVTSGTEARPKMVVVSANVMSAIASGQTATAQPHPGWRHLLLSPMGSGLGILGLWGTLAFNKGTLVISPAFEPESVLRLISQSRVTHMTGVPTHMQMLLDSPALVEADLRSLQNVLIAGSAATPTLVREVRNRICPVVVQAYGASEGVATFCLPGDPPVRSETTVGRPLPEVCEVRVVDSAGHDVPVGQVGEIWGRGPFAPLGYVGATLKAGEPTTDGWIKSGDIGAFDDDGYLRIVGRIKDIIVRGGFNISARSIEERLAEHPAISAAACVAMPDPRLGETVCAFVELAPQSQPPSLEDLRGFLAAAGLAATHVPERLVVVPELPRAPSGKILKRVLRDWAAAPPVSPSAPTSPAQFDASKLPSTPRCSPATA